MTTKSCDRSCKPEDVKVVDLDSTRFNDKDEYRLTCKICGRSETALDRRWPTYQIDNFVKFCNEGNVR